MGTKRYYDLKIAVPFFYGKNKFTITRKSEWSVLDLLFLRKIAELPIDLLRKSLLQVHPIYQCSD